MKLYTAHKILMASAMAGCLAYVTWAGVQFANDPVATHGAMLGGSLIVTGGVAVYLRGFIRRIRAQQGSTPTQEG